MGGDKNVFLLYVYYCVLWCFYGYVVYSYENIGGKMKDLLQEALDEMNRLLLNQQRLKMKLERMDDKQIADLSKKVERLQEQLKEANKAIKEYAWDSGYWECGYHYKDSFFADIYIEKWGVK